METKQMTRQVRLTHWAVMMRERTESGKSIRSWCMENGIREKTYHYWQRKLRESACEQLSDTKVVTASTDLITRSFAEVKVLETPPLPEVASPACGEIRIEAAGVRITADSAYPPAKLAELIKGLTLC